MKALRESTAELLQREAARYSSDELDKAYSSYLNEAGFQVALLQQGAMHGFMYRLFKACPSVGNSVSIVQPPGCYGSGVDWEPTVYNRHFEQGLIRAFGTPSLHSNDQVLTQTLLAAANTQTRIAQLRVDPPSNHFFRQ
ncbi:unnamed protein product [Zymoseptoria tritici ST99CH_3D7]|uniref:Uncharacterized protein n=1 Tax=Zymoseptoria tritici (strain ST99CH_3D7) TaxID=1276538 RepID=A0A1X7S1Q0_ZYMT9|nr:unnamed protein product [Zymoseptoria tritici ST99CH_3D7]